MPLNGRILALDYGKRRIGLALSDGLALTAQGLETFHRATIREDLAGLAAIIRDREVCLILMGNPLHMSGDEGRQSERAREFGERLSAWAQVPYAMWDERWTTVAAERVLHESGMSRVKRKQQVDKLAAVILLESFLDARRWHADERAAAE